MKKAFLFLLIFLLTACNSKVKSDLPFVSYMQAKVETITDEKIFQGFIDRKYDVELSFGLSGILKSTFVNEGDFVKKGTLLARLDNEEYKLDIEKAKNELNNAYVKYGRAKSYFERISKLHKAGGISYNDWENAETDLKSNSNTIKILTDSLKLAKNKEKFSNIYAPADGYVIKTFKDNGQYVQAGEKTILFQGKGGLEARTFVSQNYINSIKIGDEILLKADAINGAEFKGRIKSKVNSSIENGSYRVTVSISPDTGELLDGMSVKAYLKGADKKGILIPKSSILSDIEGQYIYILNKTGDKKGNVQKRTIETGESFNGKVLVLSGLHEGELYVVEGVNKIMDGAEVEF